MTFVAFEPSSGSSLEKQAILRKSGMLFISTTLKNKLGLQKEKVNAVNIYVDNKLPKIGIEPVSSYDGQRGKTRKIMPDPNGLCINLAKVLKYFKLDKRNKNYEFDMNKDKESGFFILDLSDIKNDIIINADE